MYEAASFLRFDPKLTTNDVISYCGFNDVSNFIRQFKKYFGCTPIKFRNCNHDPKSCTLWKKSYFHRLLGKPRLREALGAGISQPCFLGRLIESSK